ncbi:hypothetical protein KCP75_23660 [Salmonella enterica subsp. enterica]|nr:hypothetical protein KCP75_23660 [Salmonella enterica subsp. enterica]
MTQSRRHQASGMLCRMRCKHLIRPTCFTGHPLCATANTTRSIVNIWYPLHPVCVRVRAYATAATTKARRLNSGQPFAKRWKIDHCRSERRAFTVRISRCRAAIRCIRKTYRISALVQHRFQSARGRYLGGPGCAR